MNHTRRAFGAGMLAGLAGTAGCLGFVRGEDALAFEAVGVRPSEEALVETGYRHTSTETEPLSETIEIGGTSRDVELENVVVECDRGVDLGVLGTVRAATFIAFATPSSRCSVEPSIPESASTPVGSRRNSGRTTTNSRSTRK